jgi:hypothetical protein
LRYRDFFPQLTANDLKPVSVMGWFSPAILAEFQPKIVGTEERFEAST